MGIVELLVKFREGEETVNDVSLDSIVNELKTSKDIPSHIANIGSKIESLRNKRIERGGQDFFINLGDLYVAILESNFELEGRSLPLFQGAVHSYSRGNFIPGLRRLFYGDCMKQEDIKASLTKAGIELRALSSFKNNYAYAVASALSFEQMLDTDILCLGKAMDSIKQAKEIAESARFPSSDLKQIHKISSAINLRASRLVPYYKREVLLFEALHDAILGDDDVQVCKILSSKYEDVNALTRIATSALNRSQSKKTKLYVDIFTALQLEKFEDAFVNIESLLKFDPDAPGISQVWRFFEKHNLLFSDERPTEIDERIEIILYHQPHLLVKMLPERDLSQKSTLSLYDLCKTVIEDAVEFNDPISDKLVRAVMRKRAFFQRLLDQPLTDEVTIYQTAADLTYTVAGKAKSNDDRRTYFTLALNLYQKCREYDKVTEIYDEIADKHPELINAHHHKIAAQALECLGDEALKKKKKQELYVDAAHFYRLGDDMINYRRLQKKAKGK